MDHFSKDFVLIGIPRELVRSDHRKANGFESLRWELAGKNSIAKSDYHLRRDRQLVAHVLNLNCDSDFAYSLCGPFHISR